LIDPLKEARSPAADAQTRVLPEIKSEAEEAAWWDGREDETFADFERAAQEGVLTHGTAARRAGLPATTIRLDPADIALARDQAGKRGLKYQTYLKMILRYRKPRVPDRNL
jgi:predicted DNA binding CopG/RHH family protein